MGASLQGNGWTRMLRSLNVAVPENEIRYLAVKTLLPEVRPVIKNVAESVNAFVPTSCTACVVVAATVEAPDTAKPLRTPAATLQDIFALRCTRALVPVVTVTVGPAVDRSVK